MPERSARDEETVEARVAAPGSSAHGASATAPGGAVALALRLQGSVGNARATQALSRLADDRLAAPAPPPALQIPSGAGEALPADRKPGYEAALGSDLSDVRVHAGADVDRAAGGLGADAFTVGRDVYLAGEQALGDAERDRRIAHELVHVVQQREGRVEPAADGAAPVRAPTDSLEREAYQREGEVAAAARGEPAPDGVGEPPPAASARAYQEANLAGAAPPPRLAAAEQQLDALAREPSPALEAKAQATPAASTAPAPAPDVPAAPAPPAPASGGYATAPPASAGPTSAGSAAAGSAGPAPALAVPAPTASAPATLAPPAPVAAPADHSAAAIAAAGLDAVGELPAAAGPLADHGLELATRLRESAAARLVAFDARVADLRARVAADAQSRLAEAEAAIAQEAAALSAGAETAVTAVEVSRASEHAAADAAVAAEHARLQQTAGDVGGQARADVATAQERLRAVGGAEAQRALQGGEQRAATIGTAAQGADRSGDPPAQEAKTEAASRISDRVSTQCRETGDSVARQVRQEAERHAQTGHGEMLSRFLEALDGQVGEAARHIDGLAGTAHSRVDHVAGEAGTAIREAAAATQGALDQHRARVADEIRHWASEVDVRIERAAAQERAALEAQAEAAAAALEQGGAAAQFGGDDEDDPAAGDAARAQLQETHDAAAAGLDEWLERASGTLTSAHEDATAGLAEEMARRRETWARAGSETGTAMGRIADGGARALVEHTGRTRQTLAAGVDEAARSFSGSADRLRGELQDPKAEQALARAVDDGLASMDGLVSSGQAEIGTAPARIQGRYGELEGQARERSAQAGDGAAVQRGIWDAITGFLSDLDKAAAEWFADTFGDWWGGLLYGIIKGLVIVLVGAAALIGAAALLVWAGLTAAAAAVVVLIVGLIVGAGLGIYNRFQEFYADNPGEDAGFWRGLGLVGLGIADLTGIPYIIEGIVGQRAFGKTMDTFESQERLGMGLVFLGAAIIGAKRFFKGRAEGTPTAKPEPKPGEGAKPGEGTKPGEGAKTPPVTERVPGVYESASPAKTPAGWEFADVVTVEGDVRVVETKFTSPDGVQGMAKRGLNVKTGELQLIEINVPEKAKWIMTETPMVPNKGTPTASYLTMRQMQKLGVPLGGLPKITIRNIWNLRAILELRKLMGGEVKPGDPKLNEVIAKTNSVTSQSSAIQQSGHEILGAEVKGGKTGTLEEVLYYWETKQETLKAPDKSLMDANDAILKEFGLTRAQATTGEFFYDFDIEVKLGSTVPGSPVVPVPVPTGTDRDEEP